MKTVSIVLWLLVLWFNPLAFGQDIGSEIADHYAARALIFRHPVQANSQRYTSSGILVNTATEGAWTVFGPVEISKVQLTRDALHLSGKRLIFIYDSNRKDLVAHWDKHLPKVEVEISLDGPVNDFAQANTIIKRVFATSLDEIVPSLPDYWRDYFARREIVGAAADKLFSAVNGVKDKSSHAKKRHAVSSRGKDDVQPPEAVFTPPPEYTEAARKLGIVGDCVLSATIDVGGKVQQPQILRPLGAGLDEQAIQTVSKWQFKPATRDGQPVSTSMALEVAFQYP